VKAFYISYNYELPYWLRHTPTIQAYPRLMSLEKNRTIRIEATNRIQTRSARDCRKGREHHRKTKRGRKKPVTEIYAL